MAPNGTVTHKMTFESSPISTGYTKITHGKNDWGLFCREMGWQRLPGFQLRYIYFIDKTYRERLTVPELPYSAIEEAGARMYKGERLQAGEAK